MLRRTRKRSGVRRCQVRTKLLELCLTAGADKSIVMGCRDCRAEKLAFSQYCLDEVNNESSWTERELRLSVDVLGRCGSSPPSLAQEGDNVCFCALIRPRQRS